MKANFFSILAIFAFVLSGVAAASAQDDPSRTFEVRLPAGPVEESRESGDA